MGKSIIITAFTTIIKKAYNKELQAIYIAFSDQLLLDQDKYLYETLRKGLQIPVYLEVSVDALKGKLTKRDLLILDEADKHLLDELIDIPTCYGVLGMTATDAGIYGGSEERRLE